MESCLFFFLNQSDVLSTQCRNFLFSFKLLEFLQDICSDVTAKKQAGVFLDFREE